LNTVGNTLECNLAGILKPYRSDGYFHDEMNYKKEYCIKHGLEYFTFGARNENAAVQKIFQHLNFQTAGNDNVFHIPSLLTYSKLPVVIKEIKTEGLDSKKLYQQLLAEGVQLAENNFSAYSKVSLQLNNEGLLRKQKTARVCFSFPVVTEKEILVVMQSENENAEGFSGYLHAAAE
jgi:hypothetical protein